MHDGFELVECNGEATFLDVDFFWRSEPQHIFSSLRNRFNIDQMFDADVFAYAIAAPGTASQSERWREFEVIQIADTALGRGRIDEDSARFHASGEFVEFCLFGDDVEGYRRRVSVAAIGDEVFGFCKGVLNVLGFVHGENW